MSTYHFLAKLPEQVVEVCFAKFLEAFVQIVLFEEVYQRFHGIVSLALSPCKLIWSVYRVEAAIFLLQFLFETV